MPFGIIGCDNQVRLKIAHQPARNKIMLKLAAGLGCHDPEPDAPFPELFQHCSHSGIGTDPASFRSDFRLPFQQKPSGIGNVQPRGGIQSGDSPREFQFGKIIPSSGPSVKHGLQSRLIEPLRIQQSTVNIKNNAGVLHCALSSS